MQKSSIRGDLAFGLVISVAYCLAGVAGLRWSVLPGAGTAVWPAAGIAFAGLALGGSRLWPSIVIGRVATALIVSAPVPIWSDLLIGIATMLGAYIPVRILESSGGIDRRLGAMRDMLWLTFGGGLMGGLVSATFGVASLWLGGMPTDHLAYAWFNWTMGFFTGVLTVAPLILSWSAPEAFRISFRTLVHLVLCLASVTLVSSFVFLEPQTIFLRTWHILPALVWAALAFQIRGVSVALAIVSVFAISGAIHGTGPLGIEGGDVARVLLTQQFIATLALTMLFLAAIADERRNIEAQGRLAAIVSSSPEAIVSVDGKGALVSWNAGAEKLFGWDTAEVLGRNLEDILPSDEASRAFGQAMQGESTRTETSYMARGGAAVPVLITVAPVRSPEGMVIGAAGVIRDISSRKAAEAALHQLNETLEHRVAARTAELARANTSLEQEIAARAAAEERLRHSQKMEAVGQLTGGIAHDFNNMLSVVIGSLDMVRRRADALDPKITRLVDAALEGANRAARLTSRLLAFSRRQSLSPEVTDVNRLVLGMLELLRRTLGEEHRIETSLAGDLWPSFVDPGQLENAVVNLAVNARDAMPKGGILRIETHNADVSRAEDAAIAGVPLGQYVVLSVDDSGTGMPAHVLERAFDPFFTTKEVGKGTGLGLSMIYGFVSQSGGHVRIDSVPGLGTTVKLYLPRWHGATAAEEQPGGQAEGAAKSGAGGTVLVVEDQEEVRHLTVQMLRELGYEVIEASDSLDALDILRERHDVSLLFTDIVMPGMNGRELAIRAKKLRPEIRVLYTTGYARDAILKDGLLDQNGSLLSKPFTLEEMAAKLGEVLG